MMDFVSGSISIGADLIIVQEVLVEYRHIKEWEKGFCSFKELHVSDERKTIAHWDIEHDINYLFNTTEKDDKVRLGLIADNLTKPHSEKYNLEQIQHYIDTVLYRIKRMSERLQTTTKQG
jgi:hypothetical protein